VDEAGDESAPVGDAVTVEDSESQLSDGAQTARAFETWGPGIDGIAFERGQTIGRYLILERIGAGGMGVVYGAYDPELDRKIAVKLLRPGTRGSASSSIGEQRLMREARAMAKLAAPNVVTVHDIGTVGEHVYVAMEFVDGHTLRDWFEESPSWQEVVRVFMQAGRGLQAAHAAGMVHRDFKPDNVMLGKDGRILVMDFGLVRDGLTPTGSGDGSTTHGASDDDELVTSSRTNSALITRAGAVMGTPAYMAPEQHMGLPIDPRTDQFAFCVALYEGLFGKHPFAAGTIAALAFRITDGDITPPPKSSNVPQSIKRAVLKGLSAQPEDRFESMAPLLAILAHDPSRARKRWVVGAALTVLGGATVLGWARDGEGQAQAAMCTGADSHLEDVWNDQRRESLKAAFDETELAFAADTAARVSGRLDDYAARWVEAHTDACQATHMRGEQSAAMLDRRMACLGQRSDALDSLAQVFLDADPQVVMNAVAAASRLPAIERCADTEALLDDTPQPEDPEVARAVSSLRKELAHADALLATGRFDEGMKLTNRLVEESRALKFGPLTAEVLRTEGNLAQGLGSYETAEARLSEAVSMARASRNDEAAVGAAITLVGLVGYQLGDPARARAWDAIAQGDVDRLDDHDHRAHLAGNRGTILDEQNRSDEAVAQFEAAAEHYERAGQGESLAAAENINNLGAALYGMADYAAAERRYRQALALFEEQLGSRHPSIATALGNIALAARKQGKLTEAREDYLRALELKQEVLGEDHPSLAYTLGGLASTDLRLGEVDEAAKHSRRAVEIREAALGPDHPAVATSLNNLGNILLVAEDHEAAQTQLERALEIGLKARGPEHLDVADYRDSLGEALLARGRPAEALQQHERALKIRSSLLEKDAADLALSLLPLGRCQLQLGQRQSGLETLEHAVRLRTSPGSTPHRMAEARFALAQALWVDESSRDRARVEAGAALDAYASTPEHRSERAEVEAWLAERASTR
jgi:tetratricopeptide (TPR) repeat protein